MRKFVAYVKEIKQDVVVEVSDREGGMAAMEILMKRYGGNGYFMRALDEKGREI